MNDETDDKHDILSSKFRMQIDMQQTDENLRRVRNDINNVNIQIRQFEQDYARAKLVLDEARVKLSVLRREEFDLNQNIIRQRRAFIAKK